MKCTELSIAGAWLFEPPVFPDARGAFCAPFQSGPFREALGFDLPVAQVNSSVSARGVIRGLHYADTPPGQAKYLYCSRGAVLDVVVDLRVGSPTFGAWEAAELDGASMRAVYLAEGLGHAFLALADDSVVTYLCSTPYTPAAEHGVDPLDAGPRAAVAVRRRTGAVGQGPGRAGVRTGARRGPAPGLGRLPGPVRGAQRCVSVSRGV